jgi:hemoglobin
VKSFRHLALSICLALFAVGCSHTAAQPTLYERLGGEPGIALIVSDLIDQTTTDARTRHAFEGIRIKHLKHSITQFICKVADGPNDYEGLDMKTTHADAPVSEAEFDALVAMMRTALDRHVGTAEKNELLRRLAPLKRDIVANY